MIGVVAEGAAPSPRTVALRTGKEVRTTVLGHVPRGGTPTSSDRVLATRFGLHATVGHAVAHGRMVARSTTVTPTRLPSPGNRSPRAAVVRHGGGGQHAGVTVPRGRREEKRRRTHDRLFDEAMRLFQERGFDDVSVGDIARAAGVSVPTFYAHFDSKDHLILALPTPEDVVRLVGAFPADLPTAELLRSVMVAALTGEGGFADPDQVLARWRVVAASPGLRLRAAGFERATAEMILEALAGQEAVSPDTRVTVTALMSAYTQVLLRWAESDGRRPAEELVDEVLGALRDLSP